MTEERVLYFSLPLLNKHRTVKDCALHYSLLQDEEPELRKQTIHSLPQPRELNVDTLTSPKLYIALGKEASFAPPSVRGEGRLEFVSQVLAYASKVKGCRLDDACREQLMLRAVDLDAQQFYVFPNDYRPVTHIGYISSDLAKTLVRPSPCADEAQAADPFEEWTKGYRLQLAYREVQQVLVKIVASGPFFINVSQYAVAEGHDPLKTGSLVIPSVFS